MKLSETTLPLKEIILPEQTSRLDIFIGKMAKVKKSGFVYRITGANKEYFILDKSIIKNLKEVEILCT